MVTNVHPDVVKANCPWGASCKICNIQCFNCKIIAKCKKCFICKKAEEKSADSGNNKVVKEQVTVDTSPDVTKDAKSEVTADPKADESAIKENTNEVLLFWCL